VTEEGCKDNIDCLCDAPKLCQERSPYNAWSQNSEHAQKWKQSERIQSKTPDTRSRNRRLNFDARCGRQFTVSMHDF